MKKGAMSNEALFVWANCITDDDYTLSIQENSLVRTIPFEKVKKRFFDNRYFGDEYAEIVGKELEEKGFVRIVGDDWCFLFVSSRRFGK